MNFGNSKTYFKYCISDKQKMQKKSQNYETIAEGMTTINYKKDERRDKQLQSKILEKWEKLLNTMKVKITKLRNKYKF